MKDIFPNKSRACDNSRLFVGYRRVPELGVVGKKGYNCPEDFCHMVGRGRENGAWRVMNDTDT